ncbi:hypothetical protein DAI22_02g177500 [Oryza sativa Japonica Group]|nr:hypothetical protein DAI22_02g177500 [Oryza sativa Japonica Group]
MSPIRPKDRPGIGERWSGLGSGFRAAVAIPTVKSVPLPLPLSLPSAARCWPPPPPQVSLPFPSLPVPVFASPAPRSPRVPRLRLHARVVPPTPARRSTRRRRRTLRFLSLCRLAGGGGRRSPARTPRRPPARARGSER